MIVAALIAGLCLCGGVSGPYEPADRLDPPPTTVVDTVPVLWSTESANGRCVGMEWAIEHYSPGWDVARMSRIMYRESRCQPTASNSCCSGLFQMHRMHIARSVLCGVNTRADFYDPIKNVCAAALLWETSGYGAWTTS